MFFASERRLVQKTGFDLTIKNGDYPLVNIHNYGKSPFLMGQSTINGNFQ
jgi:hypothetical protein